MKKDSIDFLCCPTCKADLILHEKKQDKDEITSGFLVCKKCKKKYIIDEGIPNLLPK